MDVEDRGAIIVLASDVVHRVHNVDALRRRQVDAHSVNRGIAS